MPESNLRKDSSPKELRKKREKQRRREDILLAAEKIFTSEGFKETNMDQIANDAGFSKATIYQYFKSKEDLYLAVCAKAYQKLNNLLHNKAEQLGEKFTFESASQVLRTYIIEYPFYAELLNDRFIRKKIVEIQQKQKKNQKLTISEQEFFEQDKKSFSYIFRATSNNLKNLEESEKKADKKTISLIAEALGTITSGLINELLYRYKYFGYSEKEIEKLLAIILGILDFGIKNYYISHNSSR